MSYLAQVTYTGNGSTTQYSLTFPYIDSSHIKAYIDEVETSAFSVSSSTLTFDSAPANSAVIRIERQTPTDNRIVDFTDGSVLTEGDLDKSADQNFYVAQELSDDVQSKLGLNRLDRYDANNKRIIDVANPVDDNDAVNKTYLENTWLSPANKTALTTVNANISNINAVNSNESNINSVNSNETNINTVATNIGSVNTVATDIAKVITVANDLAEAVSEVETVADDLNEATSEIDTVAGSIANVDTVGGSITNVNTVSGSIANVNTVATNISNVNTVQNVSSDVTTVAGIASDVTAVANDATDIGNVSSDIANVNTVAGSISNVNTVATNVANVNTVANDLNEATSEIDTVATNIANVNTVGNAISNVNAVASNASNINAVAGNETNINAVNSNSTNINTVAGNNSNITTVAGISSDVTAVANISSDIQAVENKLTEVQAVADDLAEQTSEIDTVAGSITNVDNVGGSIANVNTVATNISNVNSVANDATDIGTVATNIANVNTVAGNNSNINTVAGNNANITTVAGINSDVTSVAGISTAVSNVNSNSSNINAVNANSSNINAVAGDATDIGTVASDIANVNTVAGISSDVTTVANDATDIGTVATNIANVNNVGGSIANVNTVSSNLSGVNSFADRYRVASSDPTTDLDAGDLAFNTSGSVFKYYDGSAWQQITAGGITDIAQDSTPELGGDLGSNGNDINFADNDKAQFGTGNDLQIYHDGSNSFIKDNGTGVLALRTNGTSIVLQNEDGSETLASFAKNGASQLYHDNSSKFVTTSSGTSTTGNIAVTGTVDGRDIASDGTKLDGIESGATADQTDAQIKTAYENNANTNAFTDTLLSKLNGIEASATADQSNAEIKTAYEANSNTNAFTDAEKTKLSGIATNANNYVLPTNLAGDDINIDTGALTGATVISDLDLNVTTDTSGRVTDANATVATRNLTLANLGYTGATDATNNTGTVTSVGISPGTGLDAGSAITSSGNISVSLDLSELTDMTADVSGANDELILLDSGAERRKRIGEIKLSQFNNDSGFTSNTGDITNVTAGTNLTGGGSSGSVTLNMATGGVGSGTYGSTSNSTKIDTITVDAYGRVTAVATGATGNGDITGVTAGTGLTGGGTSGTPTLNVDVGTSANKIVQLDGSAKLPAVDGSQLTGLGGGIEYAQTWRLTGNAAQSSNGQFGGSWELDDSTGAGSLGTAMTVSSSRFSFPVTGIWLIIFTAEAEVYVNSQSAEMSLLITTNNSSYNTVSTVGYGSSDNIPQTNGSSGQFIFDVTSTSNCKFMFRNDGHGENTRLLGDTSRNRTHFTVIRLGDT